MVIFFELGNYIHLYFLKILYVPKFVIMNSVSGMNNTDLKSITVMTEHYSIKKKKYKIST